MNTILIKQIENLDNDNLLSYLCNTTAILNEMLENINWVGFYFSDNSKLILGPFQGKIACTPLSFNKGVCAKSYNTKEVIIVPDVHKFEGHIACDSNSQSEIVLPILYNGECIGVLDIDSPIINRFNNDDAETLIVITQLITNKIINNLDTFNAFIQ